MNSQIIKRTAEKLNLTIDVVDVVDRAMFRFIKEAIECGDLKGVMLPHFGKFAVKDYNKEQYDKKIYGPRERRAARQIEANIRRLEKLAADKDGAESNPGEDAERPPSDMQAVRIQLDAE